MSVPKEMVSSSFHDQLLANVIPIDELRHNDGLALDNILSGQTYYRKAFLENPLSDLSFYLTVLDSGSAGFAYHNGLPLQGELVKSLINRNAIDALATEDGLDHPLKVSMLDAVYGEYNKLAGNKPDKMLSRDGTYAEKANFRSRLVTERFAPGHKVLLVGLVTEFVRDMVARDVEVSISDMSPELAGKEVHGMSVVNEGNEWTLGRLATCDSAIVTGAAFSTDTIDSIFTAAEANATDLHFYLETGSNFAPYLIDRGAQSVVAEKFPFYDLPGEARFEVYEQ